MSYKKFSILMILTTFFCLFGIIGLVIFVDPYFHFHKPNIHLKYELTKEKERYLNDGIVKNWDYDAIITGTSMTENFKTSELDKLFSVNSIKVSLAGAYFKETNDLLTTAFTYNNHIKYVVQSIDYSRFYYGKDEYRYDYSTYPWYLYNDSVLDDIKYVLNKEVLIDSIKTLFQKKQTSFDEYSNWNEVYKFGKKYIDYTRPKKVTIDKMNEMDQKNLEESIDQNIIKIVESHPDTQFYYFYPPYSIYYWDEAHQKDYLKYIFLSEEYVTSKLLKYKNVHLYSFLDAYDIITNLNNYMDTMHYREEINSYILNSMKSGNHELKKENYKEYYEKIKRFYMNYNYDALFQE